jgi:hypothetical protein
MCTTTLINASADELFETNGIHNEHVTEIADATNSKKDGRRRNIDPTTCERDYSYDEVEFMQALDEYKRKAKRMFPTCSEILEVLHKLGYTKNIAFNES